MGTKTSAAVVLERLMESTLDGIFVLDRERHVVFFNQACERITGFARDQLLLGSPCQDVLDCHDEHGRSLKGILCPHRQLLDNGEMDGVRQRMRLRRSDGSHVWVETAYSPLRDQDGHVDLILGIMRDVSEDQEHEQELIATTAELRKELARLADELKDRYGFANMYSRCRAMQPVLQKMQAAAHNTAPVLLYGPAGSGKEFTARMIHNNGLQKSGPFRVLSCAALSRELIESELFGHVHGAFAGAATDYPGLLRAAEGGTLHLDEICDMPIETQGKLLRAIEERRVRPLGGATEAPINVRISAATSRDPATAVATGRLRQDLFFRLNVVSIELPSLAARREDIPILVQHFLESVSHTGRRQIVEVSPKAWKLLLAYPWPGNIRELLNAVESAYAIDTGPILRASDLPPAVRGEVVAGEAPPSDAKSLQLDPILERVERDAILDALRQAKGQRNKAARLMGISRSRLYRRMDALGITSSDPGERPNGQ